jgi:hypothetical protein
MNVIAESSSIIYQLRHRGQFLEDGYSVVYTLGHQLEAFTTEVVPVVMSDHEDGYIL